MATELPGREADFSRIGSPVRAAVLLLAIYAAMHLTVGGLLQALAPTRAIAAVAADGSNKCSAAGAGATRAAGSADSPSLRKDGHARGI
ncbi:MAG: hypothetical protein ABI569_03580 [Casimicrobiaceae bacterium]